MEKKSELSKIIPPEIIVMLTFNDVTVQNARNYFLTACDLDVKYWGFKNTGINNDDMSSLVKTIKKKGKTAILEIVSYDEPSCLEAAKKAANCGIDQVMGTLYYPSIHDFLDKKNIPYKPFIGKVSGNPSILEGSPDEIISEAKNLLEKGISGFDLLAYRYTEKAEINQMSNNVNSPAEEMTRKFLKEIDRQKSQLKQRAETSVSGGINSFKQIDFVYDIASWAFTIGTALFEKKFAPNGNFKENLSAVLEHYTTLKKRQLTFG